MRKSLLLATVLLPVLVSAQLTGRVLNEKNEIVPFATVAVRGASGTQTDSLGFFSLPVPDKIPFTLMVTSIGYRPYEQVFRSVPDSTVLVRLEALYRQDTVVIITSRRRREALQDVPIAISVLGGKQIDDAGAFNVTRAKEIIPSVQMYTSNPRNTGVNIRGIGSPFGLTNDGLDPGVGFYIDGVYMARPAIATLDFLDVERIEVLRGPQGTLFGKNTTAGAFNIITRKPTFTSGVNIETSFGNYGFVQAKASVTGPLNPKLAGRLSFSGTQRDGTVYNLRTQQHINDINNLGLKGQLLYKPTGRLEILFSADFSRQRPNGYAQVLAGVTSTQRAAYRQFSSIIADLNYTAPSYNAFDRVVDHDTPWRSGNDLGGASVNADLEWGPGVLTSTTAYRYWNWDPSNDRDFTGLQALAKSQNPAKHKSWSQEFRYAGSFSDKLSGVVGAFLLGQEVTINGTEESGNAQWRFSKSSTSNLWSTPGLFEGYGIYTNSSIRSLSAALFANIDWELARGFHVQPGIRYNYDEKDVIYDRVARGGLETSDPALLALKRAVYSSQSYAADAFENNLTYQLTVSYRPNQQLNAYATYSTSFKPVGVNVAGLPTVNGEVALDLAVIKPEYDRHYEVGIKTTPWRNFTLNLTLHNSDIDDYQTNVQAAELGVNRGYIANAEKVRVRGAELDVNLLLNKHFTFYGALAYTEGNYISFTNAPLPLEETGASVSFKDISGGRLPGISKWAGSFGGEYSTVAVFLGFPTRFFVAFDGFSRSSFSSSATPSAVLNIDGYALFNGRIGFKASEGLSVFAWARNIFDKDYHEQLLAAGGNAGHYASVLGDPRTFGITVRYGVVRGER
ncbi:MAG: TonB-dependent receptor [Chitinophagaceae bacterium]